MTKSKWPFVQGVRRRYDAPHQSIWQCIKGVSSVEFALIAVPLLVLIFGTVQNLLISTARITLDSALQDLAYDATNATPMDLPNILSRKNLCSRSALFLVACDSDPEFCFVVLPLGNGMLPSPVNQKCSAISPAVTGSGCCYQLIVDYPVPAPFDLIRQLTSDALDASDTRFIRSVAFVNRT